MEKDFAERESQLKEQLDKAYREILETKALIDSQIIKNKVDKKMKCWYVRRILSFVVGLLLLGLAILCFFSTIFSNSVAEFIKFIAGIFGLALLGFGVNIFFRGSRDKARKAYEGSLTNILRHLMEI